MLDNQTETQEPTKQQPAQPAEAQNTDTQTVPYERFKEVNEGYKALKAQMAELQAAEEKRQQEAEKSKRKQLEEKEEFKQLYEATAADLEKTKAEYTSTAAKVEATVATLTAQWEAQKDLVPEFARDLVERLDITERLQWLADNKDKLTSTTTNGTPKRETPRAINPPEKQGFRKPLVKF